jgi:hypothetical protein
MGLRGVVENLDIWLAGRGANNVVHVTDRHAECDDQDETQCSVDECGPDHRPRYLLGRVL